MLHLLDDAGNMPRDRLTRACKLPKKVLSYYSLGLVVQAGMHKQVLGATAAGAPSRLKVAHTNVTPAHTASQARTATRRQSAQPQSRPKVGVT
jgi:hypothetical protein